MADNPLRKITEWTKAISLELFMSKDEILETYLNIIYTGPNIYGVEQASKYYFNKTVNDLIYIFIMSYLSYCILM